MMEFIKYNYGLNRGYKAEQDVSDYLDYAKRSRSISRDTFTDNKTNYRSLAIVPDIVSVDIFNKFGIDIHSPDNDKELLSKVANIIKTHYPNLLTSNIVSSVIRR
tara:strand:- start:691 stop:1005 length:315 start_codon:yes stop_codon:yes gene_type:complete